MSTKPLMLVLDDNEGLIRSSAAFSRFQMLAEVEVLAGDNSLRDVREATLLRSIDGRDVRHQLKDVRVVLAIRERTKLDRNLFSHLNRLELVLQTGGHAYHVDRASAHEHGVLVALGRGVKAPLAAIPELVFSFILSLVRSVAPINAAMHDTTEPAVWPSSVGSCIKGRRLGLLGAGRHGANVARIARAFGMDVVAWDRNGASLSSSTDDSIPRLPMDELLGMCDVLSVHLRLSDESRGLLGRDMFKKMKRGMIVINTARGAILDETALIEALRDGTVGGAGLDVMESEPLAADSPLRTMDNVMLTPHLGWTVREVFEEFADIAARQLEAYLGGELPAEQVLDLSVWRESNRGERLPGAGVCDPTTSDK